MRPRRSGEIAINVRASVGPVVRRYIVDGHCYEFRPIIPPSFEAVPVYRRAA